MRSHCSSRRRAHSDETGVRAPAPGRGVTVTMPRRGSSCAEHGAQVLELASQHDGRGWQGTARVAVAWRNIVWGALDE